MTIPKCKKHPVLFFLLFMFLASVPLRADTPSETITLNASQEKTLQEVYQSLYPYADCDQTYRQCLQNSPTPRVVRLATEIRRLIKSGKTRADIERLLAKRALSVLPMGKSASFSLERETLAGNPQAPITLVVFACARCPFCKVIVPSLYQEITQGPSRGRVALYFKPFPIKSHPGSLEGGLALVAAARLGHYWPFALEQYKHFDEFCPHKLTDWAVLSGMTKETFERTSQDPLTRTTLVAFKQEGLRHQIKATPTLFINGREYVYEMSEAAILDVLRELVDALPSHPAP
jgi:hypothetical protein